MLHIIESDKEPSAAMQEQYRLIGELGKTLRSLQMLAQGKNAVPLVHHLPNNGEQLMALIKETQTETEQLTQQAQALERDKKLLEPWGRFSWDTLERLKESGLAVRFFVCPAKKVDPQWETLYPLFAVHQSGPMAYMIMLSHPDEPLPEWEADEVRLPAMSLYEVDEKLGELTAQTAELRQQLLAIAQQKTNVLEQYQNAVRDQLASEAAALHTAKQVEGKVMVLEGWVPNTQSVTLDAYLNQHGILYFSQVCKPGENPPVLLKNNRFNRLFEMIGNLYSLPNYSEIDLTPFLAPFYLLFFGFCFSDAGYGLLFLAGATIAKMKSKNPQPVLTLVQLLGASTILFGILGGTFFGINLYETGLPIYSSLAVMMKKSDVTVQDIMFKASLALGLVQMLFGMFIKAVKIHKQLGFIHAVSTLSWALLVITSAVNYYLSSIGLVAMWNPVYIGLGTLYLIGIFFMNMPGKNLLLNFGAGLWDAYNTVVGGVGDLLSYVRLFALGLASGILGLVFNNLGTMLVTPDSSLPMQIVGYVAMVLILVVGHGINIFMSGLGSMVHPLRLTFVEFYKNAGFEGGGKAYNPFRKQTI